jgi:4-hydroxythreonine-4-phosphate dehydrogenase
MLTSGAAVPRLCITVGDPAGIGPEITLKAVGALAARLTQREFALDLIGSVETLDRAARDMSLDAPRTLAERGLVTLRDLGPARAEIRLGEVSPEAGRLAYEAVAEAVRLSQAGTVDAIVTAPLSKEALNLAGHRFSGHTELLAHLSGGRDPVMMLAHGPMRVSHVSTHIPIEEVPKRVTPQRLNRVIDLTYATLRQLGIATPRIAIAALNPHAGEGGIIGRQDIDVIAPVIKAHRQTGRDVTGPVPGDTVFVKLRAGQFDAVVAMYHDQGHIPVKLLGFTVDPATGKWEALSGVNITLGLPLIRTSVDHGTAFDIAGRGIADARSLIEAIDFALQLVSHR